MLKRLASFVITALLIAAFIPSVSAAGDFPTEKFPYKEMQIQVMPEFDYPENWPKDQPSLLLGYYGTFTNNTGEDFTGEVEFKAPVNDKNFEIYLVAEFPNEKDPEVQRPFEINKDKGVVTWKPAEPIKKGKTYSFVVEFYTSDIQVTDTKKFTFNYVNPADTESLDIIVYAPLKSKDFKIEPTATSTTDSEYAEKLHVYQYTNKKQGEAVNITASYVKEDNTSTLKTVSEQNPPNDENHSGVNGQSATDQVLNNNKSDKPIIGTSGAIIIGISVIIAGVFVFLGLKGNRNNSKPSGPASKKAVKKPTRGKSVQKIDKKDLTDHKKKLRAKLINGEIDEETYEKEIEKLG
ncbi:hypothetical protein HHO41_16025 [Bacillus sp. DNRA2]|uniref:hypothetical protein n=1 Tax=Bacillus sp. DNRA2 TaxID=2723053 RepID=UPI00145FC3CE|nr:hypothetical protein [Bacillus sp. DNRA2]NMD71806.1 hypothetical protein [Bacillus sp. DNRA2]